MPRRKSIHLDDEDMNEYLEKLNGYVYVEEINNLKNGSYIRYIPVTNPKYLPLKQGGVLCDLKIIDEGVSLICKGFGYSGKHFQIKFDEHLIFQKLTKQELVMLEAMEYLSK
jgi:hypothetical protein